MQPPAPVTILRIYGLHLHNFFSVSFEKPTAPLRGIDDMQVNKKWNNFLVLSDLFGMVYLRAYLNFTVGRDHYFLNIVLRSLLLVVDPTDQLHDLSLVSAIILCNLVQAQVALLNSSHARSTTFIFDFCWHG